MKAMTLMQDTMISENGLCPGYIIVQSMTNQTFSHFLRQNHSLARKAMKYVQVRKGRIFERVLGSFY